MIMRKTTYTVKRFDIDDEYYVEVTPQIMDCKEFYEFHLCFNKYGVKKLMFGIYEKNPSDEYLEEMINNNIDYYIQLYKESVF